jgi:hypothetical protein
MSFTGKATYDSGATLPELVDDVSDLVGLISPFDTPLLDAIGSPRFAARSTRHEWFEDQLNASHRTSTSKRTAMRSTGRASSES